MALAIEGALLRSLRRQPTRRLDIYEEFVQLYLEREVQKSMGQPGAICVSPRQLHFEVGRMKLYLGLCCCLQRSHATCADPTRMLANTTTQTRVPNSPQTYLPLYPIVQAVEYARQLACHMVAHNSTKLKRQDSSTLFRSESSDMGVFFGNDPLARAALHASPVREAGGFLSFIHKTVMEFFAAKAVAGRLDAAVNVTSLSAKQISLSSRQLLKPASPLKETEAHKLYGSYTVAGTRRQTLTMLRALIVQIEQSPLNHLELAAEPAVCDFLVDLILKGTGLETRLRAVVDVLEVFDSTTDLGVVDQLGKKVDFCYVRENIKTIFGLKMPRRMNRTLLHEAVRDRADKLVSLIVATTRQLSSTSSWADGWADAQDDEGKTG